jgi:phosphatidate phosphatase APP1
MPIKTTLLLVFAVSIFACSTLAADEVIDFYPVAARWDSAKDCWHTEIRSVVYEPELNSLKRRALLALLTKILDLNSDEAQAELFKTRSRHFLVDHERGKHVRIRLLDQGFDVGVSEANGHAVAKIEFKLPNANAAQPPVTASWHAFTAELPQGDARKFEGRVQCVPPRGVTIISDVDDTIKISDVTNRKELIKNTFVRPFQAVPGMAAQYQAWEKSGAVFHYLSASPWQLYLPLEEFRIAEGFPRGVWSMKHLRLTDRSAIDFLKSQEAYKTTLLRAIFAEFPERIFVLIGDTGEQDPEIFGTLAREFPQQALRVFIRESQTPASDAARFAKAFDKLPRAAWHVFTKAEELSDKIPAEWFTNPPGTK